MVEAANGSVNFGVIAPKKGECGAKRLVEASILLFWGIIQRSEKLVEGDTIKTTNNRDGRQVREISTRFQIGNINLCLRI